MKKIELTDEQRRLVGELAGLLPLRLIAARLGVTLETLKRRLKEDEQLRALYQAGRARVAAELSERLYRLALRGNVTAMIFLLKSRFGFANQKEEEADSATGDPSTVEHERERKFDSLAQWPRAILLPD